MLETQLHINETITGTEFDARIAADSEYAHKVKQLDIRLLVIRTFTGLTTTQVQYADIVAFVSNGLIAVLINKLGVPAQTYKIVNLDWGKLSVY